ncbi:hypothetical protein FRC08_012654 [Ceratobasidium sp. 394]|nr:hypothetical protein FRC08_012654 [Ceratobasidium sp. 394]
MASQSAASSKQLRHRLEEIKLDPTTSNYDIIVELLVDGKKTHKLPKIKKGQLLCWSNLCLPCDVSQTSTVTIQVTEVHTIQDQVQLATYQTAQVSGKDTFSIDRKGGKYAVQLAFLGAKSAGQAYEKAFAKAQQMENQPSVVGKAGRAGAAFKSLLALGSAMAELDPTGGAKVAFAICTKAWQHLETQDQQDTDINNLVENLASLIPSLESVKRLAEANLAETVIAMLNLIEDVSLFILNYKSRNVWARALYSMVDSTPQEQMGVFKTRFERLRGEFNTRLQVQMLETQQIESTRSKLLELAPVNLAGYDPTRACMPDTRVNIIKDVTTWVCAPGETRRLAWVHGLAGLGKSSIATSVCRQLDEQGVLAASFFCKRDNPELRDPCRIITTVAYNLALRWKPYGDIVAKIIHENPNLKSQHIRPLYDALIGKPVQSVEETKKPDGELAVVVDALDECGDVASRRQLLVCLRDMSQLVPWLKVVVTSRPDADIQEFFGHPDAGSFTAYNVLGYDALADIRTFMRTQLNEVEGVKDWPADAVERLSDRSSGLFIWARTACEFITYGHDPCKRLAQVLAGERLPDSSAQLDALYTTAIRVSARDDNEDNIASVLQCLGVVVVTATRTPLSIASLAKLLDGRISEYTLGHVLRSLSSVLFVDRERDNAIRVSHPSFMDYITDRSRSGELCVDLDEQNTTLARCCLETMMGELRFNICDLETSHLLNRDIPDLNARVRNAISPHLGYSCVYWASHLVKTCAVGLGQSLRAFLFGPKLLYWVEALSLLGKLGVAPPSLLELSGAPNVAADCQASAYDMYRFVLAFYDAISESTPHLYLSALALAPDGSEVAQRMRRLFPNRLIVTEGAEQQWTPCSRTIWCMDEVNSTVFSSDGRRIATGSDDNMVRIWDAETGAAVLEPLQGHSARVWSVAFSPDCLRIASGSEDVTVRVWDAETGATLLDPLRGHSSTVFSVVFSPDGQRIASGSGDCTVRVWDTATGTSPLGPLQGHSGSVCSVAFSPDGRLLLSGSNDWTVRMWDAETGAALLAPLQGHSDAVQSVAFSPDSRRIVSGSGDKTVRLWDAETGAALLEPLRGHSDLVRSVMFSLDGRRIVSGSSDQTVRVWDANTGAALLEPLRGHSGAVYSAAFSPDSLRIVSGSSDKTARIWDTKIDGTARNVQRSYSNQVLPTASSLGRTCIIPSLDEEKLIGDVEPTTVEPKPLQGSDDSPVDVEGAETGAMRLESLQGHSDGVKSVAFSPDGHRLVSGSYDGTVRLWDAETGAALLAPLRDHLDAVHSVAFSPDGSRIASGSLDMTIRLWDAETGAALLEPLRGHSEWVQSVMFSPDSGRIVSGSGDMTIQVWDVETGAMLFEPLQGHSQHVCSVGFSPNGRRLVSGSGDMTVRLWDAETGAALLVPLEGHWDAVYSVAFSPDSRRIVSGSSDMTVRLWDAETGAALLEPLRGHSDWVRSARFSPDGCRIVSGSHDKAVRVWDADTGAALLEPLQGHSSFVYSVAFSPDNRHVASASGDYTTRIWDIQACVETRGQIQGCLSSTRVSALSTHNGQEILLTSPALARHSDSQGWVTTPEGGLFIWLPQEFRWVDESSICIPLTPLRPRMVVDLSKFVHGSSWSLIVGT